MLSASAVSGNNSWQGVRQPPNSQPSSPDAIAALLWEPFLVRRLLPKAAESRQVSSWAQLALLPSLRINIAAAELGTRQKKMAELGAQSVPNQGSDLAATTFVTRNHLNRLFEPLPSVFWQNNRIPSNCFFCCEQQFLDTRVWTELGVSDC